MMNNLPRDIFFSPSKFAFFLLFAFMGWLLSNPTANAQSGQLVINVKAGAIPLAGVPVYYTCNWAANLGAWSSWNSGITGTNGQLITPVGENLHNVVVEIGYIPWDIQQLYGNTVYPAQYTFDSLSGVETIEFNLNPAEPEIEILVPASSISVGVGDSLIFSASVLIEAPYLIDSVWFTIDGTAISYLQGTGGLYTSALAWFPALTDFYQNHFLQVTAYGSNGSITTENLSFYLGCSGMNCPNQPPSISWLAPSVSTLNQPAGFVPLNIQVSISDPDGLIVNAQLLINGNPENLTISSPTIYEYNFLPSGYGNYQFSILAVDDDNDTTLLIRNLTISSSIYTPLPEKVIVGYWHSWDDSSAPFMYLSEVAVSHFNVVVYSFIETAGSDGFTPQLTLNTTAYQTGGVFNPQLLKDDIQSLKNLGIPVLVSIGGQNGHVELNTEAQKDTFVNGIIQIVEEYGFDGIDLDFEGGSMNFGAGALSDFSYSSIASGNYPKLKNVIDAFIEIDDHFGPGFHLTAAPELFYVQVGYGTYSNLAGSFLPVIENLRTRLDYIHVQLYNSGSVVALDNVAYSTGSADFIVAMTDMLLKGFNVSTTGIHFDPLDESQVVIGLPACPNAAPAGGFVQPNDLTDALNYLVHGITFSGNYDLQGSVYTDLRGVMTWSVNWDKTPNCGSAWEFSDNAWDFFATLAADTTPPIASAQNISVFLDSSGIVEISPQEVNLSSSDNIGISLMILSDSVFDCNDLGDKSITLTVFDLSGNYDTATCIVSILDTLAPVIIINDTLIDITNGPVVLNANDYSQNCSDNCSVTQISITPAVFSEPGVYSVLFIASDQCYNTTLLQFQVTAHQFNGLDPVEYTMNSNVYPNPVECSGILQIESADPLCNAVIIHPLTRRVFKTTIFSESEIYTLRAPDTPGLYLLQLRSVTALKTFKILVY